MSAEFSWAKQTAKSTPLGVSTDGAPTRSAASALRDAVTSLRHHGLAKGTKVETPTGLVAVEALVEGELVCTTSGDTQALRRIRSWSVEGDSVCAPVYLQAGVLGNDSELRMVPSQKIILSGYDVEMYFGCEEAEICATDLVALGLAEIDECAETYFELTLERAEPILAEGLAVETPDCPVSYDFHDEAQMLSVICARLVLRADETRLIASLRQSSSVPVH